jgi:outer membrane receptor for ferric coprogen and ferric-rhodotorulic acid
MFRHSLPFACIASVLMVGSASIYAQTATIPSESEVIRLNPFEVIDSQDDSFRAMSVGSGSRLRLDLKDTPVSYSVVNREFIDALGIVDLAEAAAWTTGQTFYQTDNGGDGFGRPSQYFSRGVLTDQGDSFGAQRNFYQNANSNGDSYAVESYDFGRGPNAALFGSGSDNGGLSGVSSIQSKRARFDNSRTTVGYEFGSWDYSRATIDINRPITERIGIRINAVDSFRHYWRYRDMQSSRGLTIATTWRITDNLELRAEASYERSKSHNTGGGQDEQFSSWDGHTVFRGPITNAMLGASNSATPGANNVANASYGTLQVLGLGNGTSDASTLGLTYGGITNGIKREGAKLFLYDPYEGSVMNYQNYASTLRHSNNTRSPIWSRTAPNGAYYVRGSSGAASYSSGRSLHVKQGLPADVFARAEEGSKFRVPSYRYTATIDHPSTGQRSRDFNMALTFTRGNLAAEIGGDINKNEDFVSAFDHPQQFGGRSATIDLAMLRPDGSPNQGFLDVINYFAIAEERRNTTDRTVRANVGYTADWGRLGNYVFNVQGSWAKRNYDRQGFNLSMRNETDPRLWYTDVIKIVNHWSDQVRAWTEPAGVPVNFTNVDWSSPNNPVIMPTTQVAPQWVRSFGNVGGGTFLPAAPRDNETVSRYALAQTTAKWFNDRLVATIAFRRDNNKGNQRDTDAIGDYPANWDGSTIIWRPEAPADYFSMTYLERNNKTGLPVSGTPRLSGNRPRTTINGVSVANPLYANDRFRDDYNAPERNTYGNNRSMGFVWHATNWLSPYFNTSDSYTPQNSTSLDLNGDVREPVSAYGYDFGANLSLLNERVTFKYNYYRQVRENDNFNTAGISGNINGLYAANHYTDGDTTASGRNARGAQDLPGQDYQNRRQQGYELELSVEGMIPGLRVTANGSYGWFSIADRGRLIRAFVPANATLFREILEDAGGMLDTTQRPALAPSAPGLAVVNPAIAAAYPTDQQNAIDNYNNLWRNYDALDEGRIIRTSTQPQMNIVVDYTLQRGRLAGLGMSAGLQWQGRLNLQNMGSQTIIDPNNPLVAIDDPSVDNFIYRNMKGSYNSQINMRYTWRMDNGNSLAFALRVDNPMNHTEAVVGDNGLGGGTGFGGYNRQPDGDLSKPNRVPVPDQVSRYKEGISFRLSTTYTFGGGMGRTQ